MLMSLIDLVNLKNIKMVFRNISKVGFVTTFQYIISDFVFDLYYQVDTINTIMLDELEIDSPNKSHGRYYEGTNSYVFKRVFSKIKIDAPGSCFVDFGSGKGKAMLLAAERRFRKVIGVEFSVELVNICRKNLEIFKRKTKTKTEFEIVHLDAEKYEIPYDANFLFFANPFDEILIAKVINNILKSLEKFPREIVVVHLHPQGNMAFLNHPRFQLDHETKYGYVFRLRPGNQSLNG
jgi:SAM-dependent methyltransferase